MANRSEGSVSSYFQGFTNTRSPLVPMSSEREPDNIKTVSNKKSNSKKNTQVVQQIY